MSKLMEMKVLHTFDTLLCLSAHKGNRRGGLKSTILPQTDKGPLCRNRGEGGPLILYSNRVLCLLVLTMTITLTSAMTIA